MNVMKRLRGAVQSLAVAALAGCGGGGGEAPPPNWSEPVLLATTPGMLNAMSAREDASGAWTVAWSQIYPKLGSSGWLHRGVQGSWSSIPGVPVPVDFDRNSLAAFVTSPEGPLGALVFDDGYRLDESARVDTDPRPEHFEPFVREAGAWKSQPEFAPGIRAPACVQPAAPVGNALCLLSDPVNGYPRPSVLRFTPAQGWAQTAEALDMGADESTMGIDIRLRSLAMNPAGDALAVWARGPAITGLPAHTAFHLYSPDTGWGVLGTLPEVDAFSPERQGPAIAAGAGSFMVPHVACTPRVGGPEQSCAPAVTRYTPSGGWQTQELASRISVKPVYTPGWGTSYDPLIRAPELHLGAAGQVLALWWVGSQQRASVFHPQEGWRPASDVQSGNAFTGIYAARVDDEGGVLLVDELGVMRYLPQTGWRRIAPLPAVTAGVHDRRAMIDAKGQVTLLWAEAVAASGVTTTQILTSRFRP